MLYKEKYIEPRLTYIHGLIYNMVNIQIEDRMRLDIFQGSFQKYLDLTVYTCQDKVCGVYRTILVQHLIV